MRTFLNSITSIVKTISDNHYSNGSVGDVTLGKAVAVQTMANTAWTNSMKSSQNSGSLMHSENNGGYEGYIQYHGNFRAT